MQVLLFPHPSLWYLTILCNYNIFFSFSQFYSLDVYGKGGKPLNIKQLYKQLKWIADNTEKPGPALGILTMEHRHTWAKIYKKMMKGKVLELWTLSG